MQVEIEIKHHSHNKHPLVAVCRDTLSLCDVCGENHEGGFFLCRYCNFWIHRDCTLLPSIAKHPSHDHHLVLTYALSTDFYKAYVLRCRVCGGSLRGKGLYACAIDRDFIAHMKCVVQHGEFHSRGVAYPFTAS
ncbi:cysteine/Histidine-rich C1 domain family protein [Striga asiatica]|uniref:Cysteine/Histidine-rich C1 domain family protein n=1 Tax=Striga asiatica TaxID=4170 RepID=A0A5A7QNZ4_STRAF|nr:cysteine/Histidine-rich C1 domain family protein [Striga asiatica]